MNRDEIERILQSMADQPVEPLDELDLTRLEARWRTAAGAEHHHAGSVVAFRRRRVVLVTSAALIAAAASVAVAISLDHQDRQRVVVVADAEDIVIVMPDGHVVDPRPGEQLPEGAFVQAGPYAAGSIGGSTIRPDDLFRVVDGHLQTAGLAELTATTTPAAVPIVTNASARRTEPTPALSATTTTLAPVEHTEPPTTPPTTPATTESAGPTVETPSTPPLVKAARLKVSATLDNGTVRLQWASSAATDFRRYIVFRVKRWDGSGQPTRGRLATIADPGQAGFVDATPTPGTVYVVVVVGAGRQILAMGSAPSPVKASGTEVTTTTAAETVVEPSPTPAPWGSWPHG